MPFSYFGGKKGLARYYPPPACSTIIEPFAGSAGYSLYWATPAHRVILLERDPIVVALWRRLTAPDAEEDVRSIVCPAEGGRTSEPLVLLSQKGQGGQHAIANPGRDYAVTGRMVEKWPSDRARILASLPLIRGWEIVEGDYSDAPDVRATWFVDPPYWVPEDAAGKRGDGYACGASGIDFDALGEWCRARKGQTIVCEQEGATWLPFRPMTRWTTAAGGKNSTVEVVWTMTPGSVFATTPTSTKARAAAQARRSARLRKS